jgi:hypothetical protein
LRYLLIIGAILTAISLISVFKTESEEFKVAFDAPSVFQNFQINQEWSTSCLSEYVEHSEESELPEDEWIELSDIQSLTNKGHLTCLTEFNFRILPNLLSALGEALYVPHKAVVPYEILKRSTFPELSKVTRCSDIVKPMLNTCPTLIKPFFKKIKIAEE